MSSNIQRAIDHQARLEAEATQGPWSALLGDRIKTPINAGSAHVAMSNCGLGDTVCDANAYLIAHLRNQAALARAVIEAANALLDSENGRDLDQQMALGSALTAWADHVNGETP